jgi:hypothetical protein
MCAIPRPRPADARLFQASVRGEKVLRGQHRSRSTVSGCLQAERKLVPTRKASDDWQNESLAKTQTDTLDEAKFARQQRAVVRRRLK